MACLVFALAALPLASRPRRGGRAAGFLLALLLIGGYYILFVVGAGMARAGSLPAWLGMWAADIGIGLGGLVLLPGMTRIQGESKIAQAFSSLSEWSRRRPWREKPSGQGRPTAKARLKTQPQTDWRMASIRRQARGPETFYARLPCCAVAA